MRVLPRGKVFINAKAEETLKGKKAASLLLVGVVSIEGDFEEGDIINVVNSEGKTIAVGCSGYNAEDAKANIGVHDKTFDSL